PQAPPPAAPAAEPEREPAPATGESWWPLAEEPEPAPVDSAWALPNVEEPYEGSEPTIADAATAEAASSGEPPAAEAAPSEPSAGLPFEGPGEFQAPPELDPEADVY